MVQVYGVYIESIPDSYTLDHAAQHLDPLRRERIRRLSSPLLQTQRLVAGLLLQRLFGTDKVTYLENGKPYLPTCPDTHFNLSHTDRWVFCATADVPVGLDAQALSPCRTHVARRWFTEEERQWMQEEPDVRFTRLWTHKEAAAKLTGVGLPRSLHLSPPLWTYEYPDLNDRGIYICVCTNEKTSFDEHITLLTEPLL